QARATGDTCCPTARTRRSRRTRSTAPATAVTTGAASCAGALNCTPSVATTTTDAPAEQTVTSELRENVLGAFNVGAVSSVPALIRQLQRRNSPMARRHPSRVVRGPL